MLVVHQIICGGGCGHQMSVRQHVTGSTQKTMMQSQESNEGPKATGLCGERGCPMPQWKDGLCRHHWRYRYDPTPFRRERPASLHPRE